METTPISSLKVTSKATKLLFHRSRESMTWRRLDLSKIDFAAKAPSKSVLTTRTAFEFVDVTAELA